ncbi:MAG TPA: antibiotic biosynthesis monooxygenase [Aggregatilineales bacterium]|mgnify:CR=1 FL=1|nr:antibiotic biosynthesis monooxygenase [Anaerolineales bacterium]HRE46907.1 antibiotic biosynthesis monooxygenase [Aggregatilineales bacterium]
MFVALIHIRVKPEFVDAFIAAALDNVRNSVQEAGIFRFDFIQQEDDPTRFVLIEAYRDPAVQLAHRETAHYLRWRDAVADMMAEPRTGIKYTPLYPTDSHDWTYPTR